MELLSLKQRFGIIGNAPELNYALSVAQRVAPTNLSVLISGESGVGKENFSKIIHQFSTRKHEKFTAINTGAIPDGTVDSELFGHKKGAFTGATEARKGYFESLNGGTIFLDEIGEMPLGTQARLLRVLESGEFIPVGSSEVKKTDVRVVAATNVDLFERVREGKFREDLYYRLNTVPISVPALRKRGEDILLLYRKFATDFAEENNTDPVRLSDEVKKMVLEYSWPGNVRQLKNFAQQIPVLNFQNEQMVGPEMVKKVLPNAGRSFLPAKTDFGKEELGDMDKDLMYKMLIQIKQDMNSLKQFVLSAVEKGQLSSTEIPATDGWEIDGEPIKVVARERESSGSLVIPKENEDVATEVIHESLTLSEIEKEVIIKALHKHKGKRRDAALDLGISERTLYRKIKEYDIATK